MTINILHQQVSIGITACGHAKFQNPGRYGSNRWGNKGKTGEKVWEEESVRAGGEGAKALIYSK